MPSWKSSPPRMRRLRPGEGDGGVEVAAVAVVAQPGVGVLRVGAVEIVEHDGGLEEADRHAALAHGDDVEAGEVAARDQVQLVVEQQVLVARREEAEALGGAVVGDVVGAVLGGIGAAVRRQARGRRVPEAGIVGAGRQVVPVLEVLLVGEVEVELQGAEAEAAGDGGDVVARGLHLRHGGADDEGAVGGRGLGDGHEDVVARREPRAVAGPEVRVEEEAQAVVEEALAEAHRDLGGVQLALAGAALADDQLGGHIPVNGGLVGITAVLNAGSEPPLPSGGVTKRGTLDRTGPGGRWSRACSMMFRLCSISCTRTMYRSQQSPTLPIFPSPSRPLKRGLTTYHWPSTAECADIQHVEYHFARNA